VGRPVVRAVDLADLTDRQNQISEILHGLAMRDALTILAWMTAAAIHQSSLEPRSEARVQALNKMSAEFSEKLNAAIVEYEKNNDPPERPDGMPEGSMIQ
jgi:hypothetical protein